MNDRTQKICGWIIRGGIATVGDSYMGAEPMEAMHRITSTVSQGSDPRALLFAEYIVSKMCKYRKGYKNVLH